MFILQYVSRARSPSGAAARPSTVLETRPRCAPPHLTVPRWCLHSLQSPAFSLRFPAFSELPRVYDRAWRRPDHKRWVGSPTTQQSYIVPLHTSSDLHEEVADEQIIPAQRPELGPAATEESYSRARHARVCCATCPESCGLLVHTFRREPRV